MARCAGTAALGGDSRARRPRRWRSQTSRGAPLHLALAGISPFVTSDGGCIPMAGNGPLPTNDGDGEASAMACVRPGTPREVAYSPAHPALTLQRRWFLIGGRSRRCTQPPGGATPVLLFRRRCFGHNLVRTFTGDSLMSGSSCGSLTDVGGVLFLSREIGARIQLLSSSNYRN
jgi:hypothetical protein